MRIQDKNFGVEIGFDSGNLIIVFHLVFQLHHNTSKTAGEKSPTSRLFQQDDEIIYIQSNLFIFQISKPKNLREARINYQWFSLRPAMD